MPDRLIRDEILDSDRWLSLPSDTDRLAFVGFLLSCDDFGNLEGGLRRLFRFMHSFTQIKTEEAAAACLIHLSDADMIRRYDVDGREFWHLPRFRQQRWYLARKFPASPWDDLDKVLGKNVRKVIEQGLAKNLSTTSIQRNSHVAEGVGVRGRGKDSLGQKPVGFDRFWAAYPRKKNKGQAEQAWAKLKPGEQLIAQILQAIEAAKTSADWQREFPRFVPYPATWIRAKAWEDEPEVLPRQTRVVD